MHACSTKSSSSQRIHRVNDWFGSRIDTIQREAQSPPHSKRLSGLLTDLYDLCDVSMNTNKTVFNEWPTSVLSNRACLIIAKCRKQSNAAFNFCPLLIETGEIIKRFWHNMLVSMFFTTGLIHISFPHLLPHDGATCWLYSPHNRSKLKLVNFKVMDFSIGGKMRLKP
jgi:hypothetical protein